MKLYAQVVVDTPVLGVLDYRVHDRQLVSVGDRVEVPLGTRKVIGVVVGLQTYSVLRQKKLRKISTVLKNMSPLSTRWLDLTRFAARYYVKTWGNAALSALPLFLKRKTTSLQEKRWFRYIQKRRMAKVTTTSSEPSLTVEQESVYQKLSSLSGFQPYVLFGVTGSGKTEVYLRWIQKVMESDPQAQVLLLVPEINLTPQLLQRVQSRFPQEHVVSLHSELPDLERAYAWWATHEGKARIVVATRLGIFTSFKKLGLVIVDEEHDASYKAGDGLFYSARDLAVWRAKQWDIPVVLGSATPSLETWAQVQRGHYQLLELKHRAVHGAQLPRLRLVDMKMTKRIFHKDTLQAIENTLRENRQVLVFLNRRGYSPVLSCPSCGWVCRCPYCSVRMVYHKSENRMICHHCGWSTSIVRACPQCGDMDILPRGYGTERVEEILANTFSQYVIARIDRDSVTTKNKFERLIQKVHNNQIHILIGTQMLAKGHDFQNIGLVVVLNADAQLKSASTRAREHLFATLMQVAGRAGRSGARGIVLVQTNYLDDYLFQALQKHRYEAFAQYTLLQRQNNRMPPYVYQALLYAKSSTLAQSLGFLNAVVNVAQSIDNLNVRVYDPVPMNIVRINKMERAQLLVESDSRARLNRMLHYLQSNVKAWNGVTWGIEVDPFDI